MIEFKKWEELTKKEKTKAEEKYKCLIKPYCVACHKPIQTSLLHYWRFGNYCSSCSVKADYIVMLIKAEKFYQKTKKNKQRLAQMYRILRVRWGVTKKEFQKSKQFINKFRRDEMQKLQKKL